MTNPTLRRFAEPLHALLREVYDGPSLAQVLLFRLNERLDRITPDGAAFDTVVFHLVLWADQQGRLLELIRVVAADKPQRPDAASLLAEMERAATAGSPTTASEHSGMAGPATRLPEGLDSLIRAYERIRRVLPEGTQQTVAMEEMVTRMRELPLETYNLPDLLHLSPSEGERLAAAVALRKDPKPLYLRWLAERIGVEYAFPGYQAAVALREAAHVLAEEYLDSIMTAAREARQWVADKPGRSGRREILDEVLHVLATRTASH